jgi:plasmid rolling circle replication initiator protein Rep
MTFLTDLSDRDKPWDDHRNNADKVSKLYQDGGLEDRSARMLDCANTLHFALHALDTGELRFRLKSTRFCRQRLCPVCQWRRMLMWRARFFKALPEVFKAFPKHRWIFLTLTVRNCPLDELRATVMGNQVKGQKIIGGDEYEVSEGVRACRLRVVSTQKSVKGGMSAAWDRFVKYKDFPAIGWIRTLEVTRPFDCYDKGKFVGRHGKKWIDDYQRKYKTKLRLESTWDAHPHYHCLLMVQPSYFKSSKYLSNQKWRELWQKALRCDYLPTVNVKVVKPHEGDSHPMARGILETIKYGVKESDLLTDADWLVELTAQMNNLKTIALGGELRKFLKEDEPEDLIHTDEDAIEPELLEQYPELLFDWKRIVSRYVKSDISLNDDEDDVDNGVE